MKRFLYSTVLVLLLATPAYCQKRTGTYPGILGTVESLGGRFFIMDADGVSMKVYGDANTRFKIGNIFVSGGYVVKNTQVSVNGTSDRVGEMNAVLVIIIPSTETVSGTIKKMKSGQYVLETEKGDTVKVNISTFTKFLTGKLAGSSGKKTDSSMVKVGTKIDVTPITNNPDVVDAWEINVQPSE